jgi:hypothetical protein
VIKIEVVKRRAIQYAFLLLAGCSGTGTTGDGGYNYGFGTPTLQLTINGVRFGPSVPDAASGGELVTTRDASGQVVDSTFRLSVSSAATGAACNIAVQRFGSGVGPIIALPYQFATPRNARTDDGTVAAIGGESVSVPQGTWQCTGSSCDGSVLSFTVLAADHVEGLLTGTFQHTGGMGEASVVCSFYVPMRTYVP